MDQLIHLKTGLEREIAGLENELASKRSNLEAVSRTMALLEKRVARGNVTTRLATDSSNTGTESMPNRTDDAGSISNSEIRGVINAQDKPFGTADIEAEAKKRFPNKTLRAGSVATVVHILKGQEKLRVISEREGKKGARYSKI